jgi:hypothetical protein
MRINVQLRPSGWMAWIDGEPSKAAPGTDRSKAVDLLKRRHPECRLYPIQTLAPQGVAAPPAPPAPEKKVSPLGNLPEISLPTKPPDSTAELREALKRLQDQLTAFAVKVNAEVEKLQAICKHVDESGATAVKIAHDGGSEYSVQCDVCGATW